MKTIGVLALVFSSLSRSVISIPRVLVRHGRGCPRGSQRASTITHGGDRAGIQNGWEAHALGLFPALQAEAPAPSTFLARISIDILEDVTSNRVLFAVADRRCIPLVTTALFLEYESKWLRAEQQLATGMNTAD